MDGVPAHIPTQAELALFIDEMQTVFKANPQHPSLVGHPEGNPVQIRPAFPDAATISASFQEGVSRNQDRWLKGVQNPRANFKDAALKAAPAWEKGVQAAVAAKSYARGMAGVNADQAIDIATAKGPAGYAEGVRIRTQKHMDKMAKVAPLAAAAVQAVRALPAVTDADREARAVAMIRGMRAVGDKVRGA